MDSNDETNVRAMTLIMDNNDAGRYFEIQRVAREAVANDTGAPAPTLDTYRQAYRGGDTYEYAQVIGSRVADLLREWIEESIPDEWMRALVIDVLNLEASSVQQLLGEHYLPEPDDMADHLTTDDETDETEES